MRSSVTSGGRYIRIPALERCKNTRLSVILSYILEYSRVFRSSVAINPADWCGAFCRATFFPALAAHISRPYRGDLCPSVSKVSRLKYRTVFAKAWLAYLFFVEVGISGSGHIYLSYGNTRACTNSSSYWRYVQRLQKPLQ